MLAASIFSPLVGEGKDGGEGTRLGGTYGRL
jgi:hypothetical protein